MKKKILRFIRLYFISSLIISIILLFFFFLLKQGFSMKFMLIDDHEIPLNTYLINKLGFFENYERIIQQDIINRRFRASYWLQRNFEFLILKDKPFLYYLNHFLLISISFILLYKAFFIFLRNRLLSLLVIGAISLDSLWIDMYTRLAPAEKYSFFWMSATLFLIAKIIIKKKFSVLLNLLLFLSILMLVFTKENFFIFAPLYFIFLLWQIYFYKEKIKTIKIIVFILLGIFLNFLILYIVFLLKNKGVDVYGRPMSLKFRILILKQRLSDMSRTLYLPEIILLLFLTGSYFKQIVKKIILLLVILAIGAFNYIVNLGEFLAPRYYYPLSLLKFYALPIFVYFSSRRSRIITLGLILYLILYIGIYSKNIGKIKSSFSINQRETYRIDNILNEISKLCRDKSMIVVYDFDYAYYEHFFSINRFLSWKGCSPERYVIFNDDCSKYNKYSLKFSLCEDFNNLLTNSSDWLGKKEMFTVSKFKKSEVDQNCILITQKRRKDLDNFCVKEFNYELKPL